jgi:prolyl-tRNA synthetase
MKDAYSFHVSQKDLEEYYARCHLAYERIFARAGLKEVISVASDSGMMGGKVAHEFMLLSPVGEDSIVICEKCDYRANLEAAISIVANENSGPPEPLKKVHTPDTKTIDEVCHFLGLPVNKSCKAVIYQKAATDEYVIVFIRGDLDVNETKLRNHLREEIYPAAVTDESGLTAGYLGPIALKQAAILFDNSLIGINNLCCGANEIDYHYTGVCLERDFGTVTGHDLAKATDGGKCPECGQPALKIVRGIEVGNIFQLGNKYTSAMNMSYVDSEDNICCPVMGCYGIGVGRLAASVCEAYHDEHGPVWPLSIAPWQVHICCVRADDPEVKQLADELYEHFTKAGIETIYDDRYISAGIMFAEADLLGVPVRVIVSPRNLKEGCCEITTRDKQISQKVEVDKVIASVRELIAAR